MMDCDDYITCQRCEHIVGVEGGCDCDEPLIHQISSSSSSSVIPCRYRSNSNDSVSNEKLSHENPALNEQFQEMAYNITHPDVNAKLYLHQMISLARMINLESALFKDKTKMPIIVQNTERTVDTLNNNSDSFELFPDTPVDILTEDPKWGSNNPQHIFNFKSNVGILSDRTGSGKSLTAISLISKNPKIQVPETQEIVEHVQTNSCSYNYEHTIKIKNQVACNLIIIPHGLASQWIMYLNKYAKFSFKVIAKTFDIYTKKELQTAKCDAERQIFQASREINNSQSCIFVMRSNYEYKLIADKFKEYIQNTTALVITATMYKKYRMQLEKCTFSRVFIDEADSIDRYVSTNIPKYNFLWLITASPTNLSNVSRNNRHNRDSYLTSRMYHASNPNSERYFGADTLHYILRSIPLSIPCIFDTVCIRNSDISIEKSINLPPYIVKNYRIKKEKIVRLLANCITPEIKEMIEADNIDAAVKLMGLQVVDKNESLVSMMCRSLENRIELYSIKLQNLLLPPDAHAQKTEENLNWSEITTPQDYTLNENGNLVISLARRREILEKLISDNSIKLATLRSRIQALETENTCVICFNETEKSLVTTCGHRFCVSCASKWFDTHRACPSCRAPVDTKKLIAIGCTVVADTITEIVAEDSPKAPENKLYETSADCVADIFAANCRNDCSTSASECEKSNRNLTEVSNTVRKYLIFSNHDQSFIALSKTIADSNFNCNEIKGSGARVSKLVREFSESKKTEVLMLNSRHFGSGLNLCDATDVIIYHSLNEGQMAQVIGRAHRLGQTKTVVVHKLFFEEI